jgi:hypothetical protein
MFDTDETKKLFLEKPELFRQALGYVKVIKDEEMIKKLSSDVISIKIANLKAIEEQRKQQ